MTGEPALIVVPPTVGHVNNGTAICRFLTDAGYFPTLLTGTSAIAQLQQYVGEVHWVVSPAHDLMTDRTVAHRLPHLVQLTEVSQFLQSHEAELALVERMGAQLIVSKDYFSAAATADHAGIPLVGYFTDGVESAIAGLTRQTIPDAEARGAALNEALAAQGCGERITSVPGCLREGALTMVRGLPELDWCDDVRVAAAVAEMALVYAGSMVFDGTRGQIDQAVNLLTTVPRPYVYVTFGTVLKDEARLEALPDVARATGVHLLVAHPKAGRLLGSAEGVTAVDYIPNEVALVEAVAVVHHGGFGTTLSAALAGVPQIVIPDNERTSQRMHGEALDRLGVGLIAPPEAGLPDWLPRALSRVYTRRSAARALARTLAAQDARVKADLARRLTALVDRASHGG